MIGRIGRGLADHSNVESTDPYGANDLRHHFVGEAAAQPGEPDDVHTTVAGDDTDVDGGHRGRRRQRGLDLGRGAETERPLNQARAEGGATTSVDTAAPTATMTTPRAMLSDDDRPDSRSNTPTTMAITCEPRHPRHNP